MNKEIDNQFKELRKTDMYTITISVTEFTAKIITQIANAIGTTPAGIIHQLVVNNIGNLYCNMYDEEEENEDNIDQTE